jgi:hypothetical protein
MDGSLYPFIGGATRNHDHSPIVVPAFLPPEAWWPFYILAEAGGLGRYRYGPAAPPDTATIVVSDLPGAPTMMLWGGLTRLADWPHLENAGSDGLYRDAVGREAFVVFGVATLESAETLEQFDADLVRREVIAIVEPTYRFHWSPNPPPIAPPNWDEPWFDPVAMGPLGAVRQRLQPATPIQRIVLAAKAVGLDPTAFGSVPRLPEPPFEGSGMA